MFSEQANQLTNASTHLIYGFNKVTLRFFIPRSIIEFLEKLQKIVLQDYFNLHNFIGQARHGFKYNLNLINIIVILGFKIIKYFSDM